MGPSSALTAFHMGHVFSKYIQYSFVRDPDARFVEKNIKKLLSDHHALKLENP